MVWPKVAITLFKKYCPTWFAVCILASFAIASELFVYNEMQCQDLCLRDNACTGYKTGPIQAHGKMKCLFDSVGSKTLELKSQLIMKCNQKPCKHGGTCHEDPTKCRRFYCICQKNWTGPSCDIKIKDIEDGKATIPLCPS